MADVYDFQKSAARLGRMVEPPASDPPALEPKPATQPPGIFASVASNFLVAVKPLTKVEVRARLEHGPDLGR